MITRIQPLAAWLLVLTLTPVAVAAPALDFTARRQVETAPGSGHYEVIETPLQLAPDRTAIVICDMWDQHWCRGATERVAEMAPRMNQVVAEARRRGVLIIHCPSGTLEFYRNTPQRARAQAAPPATPRTPLQGWCGLDREREGNLPIDDSDGGCDDWPPCAQGSPWTRQIPTIEIGPEDAITDSAEAYYLLRQRGIENVILMGVHLNMCVLGRPFGIRQLVAQGLQVYLMRDLTDTMYNSRRPPYVPHCVGTDLMIEHVEKYWCPSVTSADLIGGDPFRFKQDRRPRVVFLIGEEEYRTAETLPVFARQMLARRGFRVSLVQADPEDKHRFPGLVEAVRDADLLFISVRRRAPGSEDLAAIRAHLDAGKPLVGIRTASHAFAVRGQDLEALRSQPERGQWPEFDAEILGGNYHGHHGAGPITTLAVAPGAEHHPILVGVQVEGFRSQASLYRTSPLAPSATPLLLGSIPGAPPEPVAWVNRCGSRETRIFYTSLGHPQDFEEARFRRLLLNGICWVLDLAIPPAEFQAAAEPPWRKWRADALAYRLSR